MIAQNTSDIPQSGLGKFRIDLGPHLSKHPQPQICSLAEGGRVRMRQKHQKVRTGCLTCKIRRKKCDEGKPFCRACERTGRKCDGYAPLTSKISVSETEQTDESPASSTSRASASPANEQFATKNSPPKDANTSQTPDANVPCSNPGVISTKGSILFRKPRGIAISPSELTPIEALSYSYFLERTRGHVSAYFECSIWRTLAIRTNLMHPVLFKVATALGAVHRRFASGISREAFEYCFWSAALFDKAATALNKLKQNVAETHETCYNADREVVVVGEMLMSLFQVFQGDYPSSAAHASTAISTLLPPNPTLKLLHSERRYSVSEGRPRTFCRFLNALYCRSIHIFGSRIQPVASCGCFVPSTLPEFPDIFDTVELARDYLFMLVDWVMHSAERIDQDFESRREAHELGVRRLLTWTKAYAAYARTKSAKCPTDTYTENDRERVSTQEKQARMLLKLVRNAIYILLYNTHFTGIEHTLPRLPPLNESLDNDPDQDIGLATATNTLWNLIQRHQALEHDIGTVKDEIEGMIASGLIFDFEKHGREPITSVPATKTTTGRTASVAISGGGNVEKAVCPRDPTVWESVGTFSIAEKISDIEETALVAAIMHLVPEYVDQRSVDTTCDIEKRVIVVRYHYPDVFGIGLCRVQDWWAF